MERRVTPLYQALVEPLLIAGVEKPFAIVNATLAVMMVGDLKFYAWLPVAVMAHMLLRHITREDPFTRLVYVRYNRQADGYAPWPKVRAIRGLRPLGFGRGLAC